MVRCIVLHDFRRLPVDMGQGVQVLPAQAVVFDCLVRLRNRQSLMRSCSRPYDSDRWPSDRRSGRIW
jgi:hypothetical protein